MKLGALGIAALMMFGTWAACGGDDGGADNEKFATFQACYDDHYAANSAGFDQPHAIAVCCFDHPIGTSAAGVVCGDTAGACGAYVNANLDMPGADDVANGCGLYLDEKNMAGSGNQ